MSAAAPQIGDVLVRETDGVLVEVVSVHPERASVCTVPYEIIKGALRSAADPEWAKHPDASVWVPFSWFRDVVDADLTRSP